VPPARGPAHAAQAAVGQRRPRRQLEKRLDVLKRQGTPDSRAEAKTVAAVADGIRRLHAEVSAFVNPNSKK